MTEPYAGYAPPRERPPFAAYATFATHVARGKDVRFGDGRQTE